MKNRSNLSTYFVAKTWITKRPDATRFVGKTCPYCPCCTSHMHGRFWVVGSNRRFVHLTFALMILLYLQKDDNKWIFKIFIGHTSCLIKSFYIVGPMVKLLKLIYRPQSTNFGKQTSIFRSRQTIVSLPFP